MDSIDAKVNEFIATWERFVNNLKGSDFFKSAIEFGTTLVNILDKLVNKFDVLKWSTAGIILASFIKINSEANKLISGLGKFKKATDSVEEVKHFKNITNAIKKLDKEIVGLVAKKKKDIITTKDLERGYQYLALKARGLSDEEALAAIKTTMLQKAQISATVSTNLLSGAWQKLTLAIKANPIGFALAAIGAIVGFVIHKINQLKQEEESVKEKTRELIEEFSRLKTELDDNASTVDSIKKRWAELRQGVDELGYNVSLSKEEYEEFLGLNQQLAGIFPKQVKRISDNGVAILDLKGNTEELISALDLLIEKEKELYYQNILDSGEDLFAGIKLEVRDTEREVQSLKDEINTIDKNIELTSQSNKTFPFEEAYEFHKALEDIGVEFEKISDSTGTSFTFVFDEAEYQKAVKKYKQKQLELAEELKKSQDKLNNKLSKIDPYIDAFLFTNEDYKKLDEATRGIIQTFVKNLDLSQFDIDGANITDFIDNNFIKPFADVSNNSNFKKYITNLLDFNEQYRNGEQDAGEYTKSIEELFRNMADNIDSETKGKLIEAFNSAGFSVQNFTDVLSYLRNEFVINTEAVESYDGSIKALDESIQKQTEVLSNAQDSYTLLSKAVSEYNDTGYVSIETLGKLLTLGDEYLQYLTFEEGQLRLNKDGIIALAQSKIDKIRVDLLEQENTIRNAQLLAMEAFAAGNAAEAENILRDALKDVIAQEGNYTQMIENLIADNNALIQSMSTVAVNEQAWNEFKANNSFWKDTEMLLDNINTQSKILETTTLNLSTAFETAGDTAKSSAKDTKDAWKEEFEEAYKDLQFQRDMDLIDAKDYYTQLAALNQKYFAGQKQYLDDYRKYLKEVYQGLKKLEEDRLKKQAQAEIDAIDKKIKELQKEKEALRKKNEEEEMALKLQKAKDRYEAAKSQLVNRVYTNEKGWVKYMPRINRTISVKM